MIMTVLQFIIVAAFFSAVIQTSNGKQELVAKTQQAIGGLFDGCYSDVHQSLQVEDVYHQKLPKNTNSICVKTCKIKGYAITATRGQHCYCSNSLPVPPLYEAGDDKASGNGGPCNTVCPGAYVFSKCQGDECCGGTNAYSVYIVDSIDILKELINRIVVNFKNNKDMMYKRILSQKELNLLSCQCFNGEITIHLKANDLSSNGTSSIRTVKSSIDINNKHSFQEVSGENVKLRKVELDMNSIEKLLETKEPVLEKPFGAWDLLCDNYFGGAEQVCTKTFSESAGFQESFSTTSGISTTVTIGIEVESNFLVVKSKKSLQISQGYSFTKGYSKTFTDTKSEGFRISATAPKGTKTEVRFFTSDIPVKVKWRANFFADGDVLIDYGGVGIKKSVHLSRLLGYEQRRLFAFGTIDYGERPTVIARTRTVDRNGKIVKEQDATVVSVA